MVMPDGEDFVPTFLGAVWAGIVPVPLYPPLSLGKLDAYIDALGRDHEQAEPTYLVTNAKVQTVLWSAPPRSRSLQGRDHRRRAAQRRLRKARAARRPTSPPTTSCFLQFTSGSTSTPEGRRGHPRQPARERLGDHARRARQRDTDATSASRGCRCTTTWGSSAS